uniref:Uncharacterized protein n=1 Tax=Ditylenchus dipsaci TaxID=166011 RepID=A0A915DCY1_9BILA
MQLQLNCSVIQPESDDEDGNLSVAKYSHGLTPDLKMQNLSIVQQQQFNEQMTPLSATSSNIMTQFEPINLHGMKMHQPETSYKIATLILLGKKKPLLFHRDSLRRRKKQKGGKKRRTINRILRQLQHKEEMPNYCKRLLKFIQEAFPKDNIRRRAASLRSIDSRISTRAIKLLGIKPYKELAPTLVSQLKQCLFARGTLLLR